MSTPVHLEIHQNNFEFTCCASQVCTFLESLAGLIVSLFKNFLDWICCYVEESVESVVALHQSLIPIGMTAGVPISEMTRNNLYLTTNESGISEVCQRLQEIPAKGDVVVGVSGMHNLSFFISRPDCVDCLILIDPDPVQKELWKIVVESVKDSSDPEIAITKIVEKITLAFTIDTLSNYGKASAFSGREIDRLVNVATLFLNGEDSPIRKGWGKIKRAATENKIIYCPFNLADPVKREAFKRGLNGRSIDTLYTSNVHFKRWSGEIATLRGINALLNGREAIVLIAGDISTTQEIAELDHRENCRDRLRYHELVSVVAKELREIPLIEVCL